jgi:hypothetical protein
VLKIIQIACPQSLLEFQQLCWSYVAPQDRQHSSDSGAMQIFVMEGTPVINKRATTNPPTVSLADGHQVLLTHMCNIQIKGLPFPLTGHIIPNLSIASLFGIHVLAEVGCEVTFSKTTCVVKYNGNIILTGSKDQTMDLWTLPLGNPCKTAHHSYTAMTLLAAPDFVPTPMRRAPKTWRISCTP